MKTIKNALLIFLCLTLLTGIVYPLLITGVAQLVFPGGANGSLVKKGNKMAGSELIGQEFDSAVYFSSRPSAISYNPLPSGAYNYGLTNVTLKKLVNERKNKFIRYNHLNTCINVPSEMLFASASGLDPHISKKAALLQAGRVAEARHLGPVQVKKLFQCIDRLTEPQWFFCLGEDRVNVLLLNLEIDKLQ